MSRSAFQFSNFQNGCRCHGNSRNVKNLNCILFHKLPSRSLSNLVYWLFTSSSIDICKKIGVNLIDMAAVAMETKKGYWIKFLIFLLLSCIKLHINHIFSYFLWQDRFNSVKVNIPGGYPHPLKSDILNYLKNNWDPHP